jgi:hypothetical protein
MREAGALGKLLRVRCRCPAKLRAEDERWSAYLGTLGIHQPQHLDTWIRWLTLRGRATRSERHERSDQGKSEEEERTSGSSGAQGGLPLEQG